VRADRGERAGGIEKEKKLPENGKMRKKSRHQKSLNTSTCLNLASVQEKGGSERKKITAVHDQSEGEKKAPIEGG